MEITAFGAEGKYLLTGMEMVEGFLFNGIESDAGRFAVGLGVERAELICPDTAGAALSLGDEALGRAEVAMDAIAGEFLVIQSFVHVAPI